MKYLIALMLLISSVSHAALIEIEGTYGEAETSYVIDKNGVKWNIVETDSGALRLNGKVYKPEQTIISNVYLAQFASGKDAARNLLVVKTSGWNSQQAIEVFDPASNSTKVIYREQFPSEVMVEMSADQQSLQFAFGDESGRSQTKSWKP